MGTRRATLTSTNGLVSDELFVSEEAIASSFLFCKHHHNDEFLTSVVTYVHFSSIIN